MVKIMFPKLEAHVPLYVCQLGSTPVVKQISVLNFKKLFGPSSCNTNRIKIYMSMG
jgi:hypothetical protein